MRSKISKWLLAPVAVVLLAGLSGCGTQENSDAPQEANLNEPDKHYVFWQELPADAGGGKVLCVWSQNGFSGGMSCDWEGYHQG